MYLAFLTMQGFFRSFGLMYSSFHTAFRMSAIFVPNMIQYAGYMIPVDNMKRWLFWIVSWFHTAVVIVLNQAYDSSTSTRSHMVSYRYYSVSLRMIYSFTVSFLRHA